MIGVTIGIGDYREVAVHAAQQMSRMTGLKCSVIERNDSGIDVVNPSWLKCFVGATFPDEDSFLVFDADVLCLRPWSPGDVFESLGRPFCAAMDLNSKHVYRECQELNIGYPDTYVNAGLTMFGQEHQSIWGRTWKRHPSYGRWLEQSALNASLLETEMDVCRLPRRFNFVCHFARVPKDTALAAGVINYHACSFGNADKVRQVQINFGIDD